MRATIFGGYDKRDGTRRRLSCSPLSQCPLQAAPAHQPALHRQRCCSAPRWEDGAVRLPLLSSCARAFRTLTDVSIVVLPIVDHYEIMGDYAPAGSVWCVSSESLSFHNCV
jgi:hypothetical protein